MSIVVCCFNSSGRLFETFEHLADQKLPNYIDWEVVLVDNASTDSTAERAAAIWVSAGAPVPLIVIKEAQPGLAHARRAGVMAAKHDTLIFCDDDNWLAPDYAARALEILASDRQIGAVGGCSQPVFEGGEEPPSWFWNRADGYAVGAQALRSGDVTARGYLWGAGLALRGGFLRSIYATGVKPLLSGRSGEVMLSGDDSEICKWYLLAGYRLAYDETLRFRHFIPRSRQTVKYFEKINNGFLAANPILSAYSAFYKRRESLRGALSLRFRELAEVAKNEITIAWRGGLVRKHVRAIRDIAAKHRAANM